MGSNPIVGIPNRPNRRFPISNISEIVQRLELSLVEAPWNTPLRGILHDATLDKLEKSSWLDKTERLDTLPAHVERLLPAIRDFWLGVGLATGPCDRERAERCVKAAYEATESKIPSEFIWLRSPLEVTQKVDRLAEKGVDVGQALNRVWSQVLDRVRNRVRHQIWSKLWDQVNNELWCQVRSRVRDQVRSKLWNQIYSCGYGQHDAHWLAYYATFDLCGLACVRPLRPLMELTTCCGWWWPFERTVIMTERPVHLQVNGENLVCVRYADGFSIEINQ